VAAKKLPAAADPFGSDKEKTYEREHKGSWAAAGILKLAPASFPVYDLREYRGWVR